MKREDVIKCFWEELNAYTLNNHCFNDGFNKFNKTNLLWK